MIGTVTMELESYEDLTRDLRSLRVRCGSLTGTNDNLVKANKYLTKENKTLIKANEFLAKENEVLMGELAMLEELLDKARSKYEV